MYHKKRLPIRAHSSLAKLVLTLLDCAIVLVSEFYTFLLVSLIFTLILYYARRRQKDGDISWSFLTSTNICLFTRDKWHDKIARVRTFYKSVHSQGVACIFVCLLIFTINYWLINVLVLSSILMFPTQKTQNTSSGRQNLFPTVNINQERSCSISKRRAWNHRRGRPELGPFRLVYPRHQPKRDQQRCLPH